MACSFGLDTAEFSGGRDDASATTDGSVASDASDDGAPSGDGSAAFDGTSSDADTGRPPPPCLVSGDRCPDGTILAGSSTGSTTKLFTTPCDHGQTLQVGVCIGNRLALPFNDGNATGGVFVGATSFADGAGNTALLAAADANGGVLGAQPHRAAKACADLVAFGHDDWYLPAADELAILVAYRDVIGNFVTSGGDSAPFYKTSTETHDVAEPLNAARVRLSDGYLYLDGDGKPASELLRCIRKSP
jgi:hypothetical protein